jgi:hypothetical protein
VRVVTIVRVLDDLPDAITESPSLVWSVLARCLGEYGAAGRVALAWRWALTGTCPSPVTLARTAGGPPRRDGLIAEAYAPAELGRAADRDGQVEQARFVLKWLAGELSVVPLLIPPSGHVAAAAVARPRAEVEEAYFWAQLAKLRHPWQPSTAPAAGREAAAWARGANEVLAWACGEVAESPLSGLRLDERPTLLDLANELGDAMSRIDQARKSGDVTGARRLESMMEAFLWLAGWQAAPPVDRHGHLASEDCPERDLPCDCGAVGRCLRSACPACRRVACVHGFGQGDDAATEAGGS